MKDSKLYSFETINMNWIRFVFASACVAFFANFSSTSASDYELFQRVIQLHQENQERIQTWYGKALVKRPHGVFHVDFGVDRLHDVEFFYTKAQIGNDSSGPVFRPFWRFGMHRKGTLFSTIELLHKSNMETVIQNNFGNRNRRFSELSFDPMFAFKIMEDSTLDFYENVEVWKDCDWVIFDVSRQNEIVRIDLGNNTIDVDATELYFDLSKSACLTKMINPGPDYNVETSFRYENVKGVWLPQRVEVKMSGSINETKVVEFQNNLVNEYQVEPGIVDVFELAPGCRIVDKTSGRAFSWRAKKEQAIDDDRYRGILGSRLAVLTYALVCLSVIASVVVYRNASWLRAFKLNTQTIAAVSIIGLLAFPVMYLLAIPQRSAPPSSTTVNEETNPAEVLCGHYCLQRAARISGINVTEKIATSILPVRPQGNTLLELRNGLKRVGVDSIGLRRAQFEDVKPEDLPCIAQLNTPDHFVLLVESVVDGQITAIDGVLKRQEVSPDLVEERWGGNILKLEETNTTNNKGIQFATLLKELGNISDAEPITTQFNFENNSESSIRIVDVIATCDCLEAKFNTSSVLQNETGSVLVVLNPAKKMELDGDFTNSVYVEFETESGHQLIQLDVSGKVAKEFFAPVKVIDFGEHTTGERSTVSLPITFRRRKDMAKLPNISVAGTAVAKWKADQIKENSNICMLEVLLPKESNSVIGVERSTISLQSNVSDFSLNLPVVSSRAQRILAFPDRLVIDRDFSKSKSFMLLSPSKLDLDEIKHKNFVSCNFANKPVGKWFSSEFCYHPSRDNEQSESINLGGREILLFYPQAY